ncbi:MAG: polysaccharide biosynthesis tyrosine autokinase, partial [Acidobacteriota bacterium]
ASRTQTTQESNVSIVDSAIIPTQPFRPSLRSGLTQALFVGLLLGFGGIILLEVMDRTIKSPEELESILGYPTLAVVPDMAEEGKGSGIMGRYIKGAYGYGYGYGYSYGGRGGAGSKRLGRERKKKTADGNEPKREIELLPHKNPKLAVCEAYRSLRTALLLSSAEELRIVAVTSAEPGEGKTATTCNLGVVFAQLGRRVLIVDADLRRPRMHKVFKVSNRLGVVNYLTGKIEIESLFIDTGVPNLFICPSGPIPPNPSELLASDRLRDFLTQVRARFDFVLIDTPPTLPVADAVILGPLTDGLVLCARAGELLRDDAKLCRERLGYEGLRIFGTVLNRYSTSPSRYNRRYRYYGYGAYEESNPPKAHSAA